MREVNREKRTFERENRKNEFFFFEKLYVAIGGGGSTGVFCSNTSARSDFDQ